MAANTITGSQILAEMARICGELYSGLVTTATSATSIACAGIVETADDAYNGGIAWELGGSVYATISDYTGSSRTFTLASPGLTSIAVGDRLVWAWTADKYTQAFNAMNLVVGSDSWEQWGREVKQNRSTATDITLAAGDNFYDLPAACHRLKKVGIQPTTTSAPSWFELEEVGAVIVGQEGAFTLEFSGYGGVGDPAWSSRARTEPLSTFSSFPDAWANEPLLLWYETKETALSAASGTTQLPLDYVSWCASEKYLEARLAGAGQNERQQLNMLLPQVQREAAKARARLKISKPMREPRISIL